MQERQLIDPIGERGGKDKITENYGNLSSLIYRPHSLLTPNTLLQAHNYTDLANFTLKCGTCQTGLKGESDARKHAKDTGHTNFQEFS